MSSKPDLGIPDGTRPPGNSAGVSCQIVNIGTK